MTVKFRDSYLCIFPAYSALQHPHHFAPVCLRLSSCGNVDYWQGDHRVYHPDGNTFQRKCTGTAAVNRNCPSVRGHTPTIGLVTVAQESGAPASHYSQSLQGTFNPHTWHPAPDSAHAAPRGSFPWEPSAAGGGSGRVLVSDNNCHLLHHPRWLNSPHEVKSEWHPKDENYVNPI